MQGPSAASIHNDDTSVPVSRNSAISQSQMVRTKNNPTTSNTIPASHPPPPSPQLHPLACSALQWNCNGLRTRLPELREHLIDHAYDAVALQEPRMPANSIRITGHVAYYSRPTLPGATPRAALLIRRGLTQVEVVLTDLCTEVAEFVAVMLELRRRLLTIVSAYVAPGTYWDTRILVDIRRRAKGDLIVAGDFNAHSQSWGGQTGQSEGT